MYQAFNNKRILTFTDEGKERRNNNSCHDGRIFCHAMRDTQNEICKSTSKHWILLVLLLLEAVVISMVLRLSDEGIGWKLLENALVAYFRQWYLERSMT